MNVKCPHCQVLVLLAPKRASGPIYTSQGFEMTGELDEKNGIVSYPHYGKKLRGYFDLKTSQFWIVQCVNCDQNFVYSLADGRPVWPLPEMTVAEEIPGKIAAVFLEAKKAHAVGAETAALLAARTALIRTQRDQDVSSIKDLADAGKITSLLHRQADEVRLWANVTGHGDITSDALEPLDVVQVLEYLDLLFDTLYVQPAKLGRLSEKRNNLN